MWNLKVAIIPIVIGALVTVSKRFVLGQGGLGINETSGNCPNYSVFEIGKKTEKSPGDLRILAVAQTPVENFRLMLRRKTLLE